MKLPSYARDVPRSKRVKVLCRGHCGMTRYAEASTPNWNATNAVGTPGLFATCLKCGYRATDVHNWKRS